MMMLLGGMRAGMPSEEMSRKAQTNLDSLVKEKRITCFVWMLVRIWRISRGLGVNASESNRSQLPPRSSRDAQNALLLLLRHVCLEIAKVQKGVKHFFPVQTFFPSSSFRGKESKFANSTFNLALFTTKKTNAFRSYSIVIYLAVYDVNAKGTHSLTSVIDISPSSDDVLGSRCASFPFFCCCCHKVNG